MENPSWQPVRANPVAIAVYYGYDYRNASTGEGVLSKVYKEVYRSFDIPGGGTARADFVYTLTPQETHSAISTSLPTRMIITEAYSVMIYSFLRQTSKEIANVGGDTGFPACT